MWNSSKNHLHVVHRNTCIGTARKCRNHNEQYAACYTPKLSCSIFQILNLCQLKAGTHYPHVMWAHVLLHVHLRCKRRFNLEFYRADSHFRHAISRATLLCSRASSSLTFRETWSTCRVLFRHFYQLFPEMDKMLIEKVCQWTFLWHQVTRL